MKSQIVGIAWIIALLLFLTAYHFFSSSQHPSDDRKQQKLTTDQQILTRHEDSAYTSRRKNNASARKPAPYTKNNTPAPALYSNQPAPSRKQPLTIELNSADSTTLQLLHGIGPAYARRIIRYRQRLGGFVADTQLLEIHGFTPQLLQHLRPHLTLDTASLRRLAPNTDDLKTLARHPYMEYYQARDIVTLRSRGTVFRSIDDLRAVPSMADSSLQRLRPYLDFSLQNNPPSTQ